MTSENSVIATYIDIVFEKNFPEKDCPVYVNYKMFKEIKQKEILEILKDLDIRDESRIELPRYWIIAYIGNTLHEDSIRDDPDPEIVPLEVITELKKL